MPDQAAVPRVPCSRCGHLNHRESPTCPTCETMLPARHRVLRTAWLIVALPFSLFAGISLVMAAVDLLSGKPHDLATLATFLSEVLVPACIAGIGWVNYYSHKK